jgi:hypothetical protein
MYMKKVASRAIALFMLSISGLWFYGFFAQVTIHGTFNGTTYVSCTGGCAYSPSWLGSTKVCDVNNACVRVSGKLKEGAISNE